MVRCETGAEFRELERQPADLLGQGVGEIIDGCGATLDGERLERLLGRGSLR